MPKRLFAQPPADDIVARQLRKLAGSRHAPADWIMRARMIVRSWDGLRTTAIAAERGCHPQTVRERLLRFKTEGIDGLADRPGAGRKPRLTEAERSQVIALVATDPPGKVVRRRDGELRAEAEDAPAHWTLDSLTAAAQAQGIEISRSQARRVLPTEGVRWRQPHSWADSADPAFVPKGRRSSPATRRRRQVRRPSASMNVGQ